jgi:hypothetical protein
VLQYTSQNAGNLFLATQIRVYCTVSNTILYWILHCLQMSNLQILRLSTDKVCVHLFYRCPYYVHTTRHYRHYTSQHVLHDLLRHYTYYTCYSLYLVWVGGNFLTWCWASKVSRCLRCGCCERRGHTTVPPQLTPQRRTSARRKVAHLRDRAPFQSLNHRWASKELASLVLFIDDRSLARSILIAFSAMKSNPAFILHCMPDESSPEIL